ncbi:MAG: cation:proton antiporter [Planctomycetes bacterium]|nr:cation:proton antiporter [Planctomycetota bacterium]
MTQTDWTTLSLHLAAMLATALVLGAAARRLGIPAVVGEIAGGLLLGPTVLGRVAPEVFAWLFPPSGPVASARGAVARVGMLFFIVTIGLDISVAELRRSGRRSLLVGSVGTFVPLLLGFAMCYLFPDVIGVTAKDRFATALFMGSLLSLSANPVIARILMDMGLFRSDIGRTIMSATLVDDLVGWGLFAVILAEFAPRAAGGGSGSGLAVLGAAALFLVGIALAGRFVIPGLFSWARQHLPYPSGAISLVLALALVGAAGSEHLGLHSFLGAFVMGIALAGTAARFPEPFAVIGEFAYAAFTPVFFVSMAISADFLAGFDPWLVGLITAVAFLGKITGVYTGGRIAGMDHRQALAVGCGLNARGILGIVMAAAAFDAGLIDLRLFVACVLMCVITTMAAGPALGALVGPARGGAVA